MVSPPPSPLARSSRTASASSTSSIPLTADGSVVALGSSPSSIAAATPVPAPIRSVTSSSIGANSLASPLEYYFSTALPSVGSGSPGGGPVFEKRGSSSDELARLQASPARSQQPLPPLPHSHSGSAAPLATASPTLLSSSVATTASTSSSSSFYALSRSQPESALIGARPQPRVDATNRAGTQGSSGAGPLSAVSSGSEYSFGNLDLGLGGGILAESPPPVDSFGVVGNEEGDGDTTIGRSRNSGHQAHSAMPWQLPPVVSPGGRSGGDMEALLDAEIDRYSRPDSGPATTTAAGSASASGGGLPRSTRTSRLSLLDLDTNVDRDRVSTPVRPVASGTAASGQKETNTTEVTPKAQQEAFMTGAMDSVQTPRRPQAATRQQQQQQQEEREVQEDGPPIIAPIRTASPLEAVTTRSTVDSSQSSRESLPDSSGHSSTGSVPFVARPPFDIPPRSGSFASRSSWSADAQPLPSPAMSTSSAFPTNAHRASTNSRASMSSFRTPTNMSGTGANRPWPTAMLYSHVKSIRSPGGRATAYARAINELVAADSGLASWCQASRQREAPQPRQIDRRARASGLRNLGLAPTTSANIVPASPSMRNVSGASEIAFPTRSDAGQAVEIASFTIDPADPPDALPSNLPFPALAEQQQYLHNLGAGNAGGMRQSPSTQSIKSVGKGLAGFWRPARRSSGRKDSFPPPISSPIVPQVARITDNPAVRRSFDGGVPKRQTSIPSPSGPRERRSAANM